MSSKQPPRGPGLRKVTPMFEAAASGAADPEVLKAAEELLAAVRAGRVRGFAAVLLLEDPSGERGHGRYVIWPNGDDIVACAGELEKLKFKIILGDIATDPPCDL